MTICAGQLVFFTGQEYTLAFRAGEGFMSLMLLPFRRAFDYSGRSSKSEFAWFFWVFWIAILISASVIYPAMQGYEYQPGASSDSWFLAIVGIYVLVLLVVTVPLIVRRLHDSDFSGWWALWLLLPALGAAVMVAVAMWFNGTPGTNRFGPEPPGSPQ